ncbi:MAG: DASH family cryptochrome [Candidatus Kapaibacterium sp.]|nr:MAG: DASH family cryptochrome [Candidatus Kapabacteria bacterium]
MKKFTTVIVWLRNDLRLHDNEALARAVRDADEVLPVYCFDDRQFATTSLGFPKTGAVRAQFLRESVEDTQAALRSRGADLLIRRGLPEIILPSLAREIAAQAVYFHEEVTDEELVVEQALVEALSKTLVNNSPVQDVSFWGSTLHHLNDIPFNTEQLPDVFTHFRKDVEKKSKVRAIFPTPQAITLPSAFSRLPQQEIPSLQDLCPTSDLPTPDSRAVLPFKGGETQALKRLADYFWERDCLKNYKETRNGLIGADYSSKFSAWLALGCLSPRFVFAEVQRYERERVTNDSTYWLVFELLWRDFFRFTARKYDTALFRASGIMNVKRSWNLDWKAFERWKTGTTGVPFVDANMRELLLTGFMSNRGRQNVASYLVKDMKLHWHMGAEWFESQLVDYDVCSNYGNWNYAAGIGNDPREDRYFNIPKQASMYDPQGDYVRRWLEQK